VANNPFYGGPHADLLAMIPLAGIVGFLYLVAREKLLVNRK
jgi:hypothetical protein